MKIKPPEDYPAVVFVLVAIFGASTLFMVTGPFAYLVSLILNISFGKVWVSWFLVQIGFSVSMAAFSKGPR